MRSFIRANRFHCASRRPHQIRARVQRRRLARVPLCPGSRQPKFQGRLPSPDQFQISFPYDLRGLPIFLPAQLYSLNLTGMLRKRIFSAAGSTFWRTKKRPIRIAPMTHAERRTALIRLLAVGEPGVNPGTAIRSRRGQPSGAKTDVIRGQSPRDSPARLLTPEGPRLKMSRTTAPDL